MHWCHTDLGANVLRWPRFVAEDHRFGSMKAKAGGMSAEHFDGIMMMSLAQAGEHCRGLCMLSMQLPPSQAMLAEPVKWAFDGACMLSLRRLEGASAGGQVPV